MKKLITIFFAMFMVLQLSGCGTYNRIQALDEQIDQYKAEMISAGQRRMDTIDNLVSVVKAYAGHEKSTFTEVAELRAKAGSVNLASKDPAQIQEFMTAQSKMTGAVSRLLMTTENYPTLKADQHFSKLMLELKRADKEMERARNTYIESIAMYNKKIRSFPGVIFAWFFDYERKPQYEVAAIKDVESAPKVKF